MFFYLYVLFIGKTLVSKQKAIQIDSDVADNKRVFYISLLGSDEEGKPNPFRYVFDIITRKFDFWNTNVQAKDVRDLCDHYKQTTNQDSSKASIYDLCLHFMRRHLSSHFILDEVPFVEGDSKYTFLDLFCSLPFLSINFYNA